MLEHDKRIMLLRYDKRQWLRGYVVGYRLIREGNHAIKGAGGLEEKRGFKGIQVCMILEQV